MPNRSTPDYLFEEAERCFRRSRTDSNVRVELEAMGNVFMVKAVELDIKLKSREMVMIDALAFALVAVALGVPAVIMAAMLGSNLKLDW